MAVEFIHVPSVGDLDACRAVVAAIDPVLDEAFEGGVLAGFEAFIIKEEAGLDEALIFTDTAACTAGRFPFVYVAIELGEHGDYDFLLSVRSRWGLSRL